MSEEKIERFTRRESTYYEKAICRLQELENKLESGELQEANNKPLTVEELKALDIGDWVWIKILKEDEYHDFYDTGYYRKSKWFQDKSGFNSGWHGYGVYYPYEGYGKTWIAYKNKEAAEAELQKLKSKK